LSLISHRVSTAGAEPYAEEAVPERVLHNES
jgi:hypothetical protein